MKKLEIEENDDNTVIKCPHPMSAYFFPLASDLSIYYMCCQDCYEKLLGHFILELLKPIEKLAHKL